MRQIATLALTLVLAAAAQAQTTAFPKGWYDLFPPPYSGVPEVCMSIAAVSDTASYVPGGGNGQPFTILQFDNAIQGNFTPLNLERGGLMEMSIAAGGTVDEPKSVVAGMGFFGTGVHYLANKTTFLPSTTDQLMTVAQDVRMSPDGKLAMVMDTGNAKVLFSTDSGKTFTSNTVNIPDVFPCNELRYGAIVDEQTQYVSLGTWPDSSTSTGASKGRQVSQAIRVEVDEKTGKMTRTRTIPPPFAADEQPCGNYMAAIAKTTDGGKTWKAQMNLLNSTFYFNTIDCFNATLCIAVGEGMNEQAGGHIYRTTDGETWTEVLFQPSSRNTGVYSFMVARFASTDGMEAWVGGSLMVSQIQSTGVFFHTVDGGATWERYAHGILNAAEITSIDTAPNGVALATAMTIYQDSTILRYDPTGPAAPGFFTQSHCPSSGCSFLCQNATFPQQMCLQLQNGGSAIATCSSAGVTQKTFTTPDCTGASTSSVQPVDTCLPDGSGSYFENFCL